MDLAVVCLLLVAALIFPAHTLSVISDAPNPRLKIYAKNKRNFQDMTLTLDRQIIFHESSIDPCGQVACQAKGNHVTVTRVTVTTIKADEKPTELLAVTTNRSENEIRTDNIHGNGTLNNNEAKIYLDLKDVSACDSEYFICEVTYTKPSGEEQTDFTMAGPGKFQNLESPSEPDEKTPERVAMSKSSSYSSGDPYRSELWFLGDKITKIEGKFETLRDRLDRKTTQNIDAVHKRASVLENSVLERVTSVETDFSTRVSRLEDRVSSLLLPESRDASSPTLSTSPLQAILNEDKILQLFYGCSYGSIPVDYISARGSGTDKKFSMARTLSEPSLDVRHCPIEELYTLANADSSDIQKRFHLESSGEESDLPSSSESSCSSFKADDVSGGISPKVQIHDHSVGFAGQKGKRNVVGKSEPALTFSSQVESSEDSSHVRFSDENDCMTSADQILMLPGPEGDVNNGSPLSTTNSQAQQLESSLSSFASSTSLNDEEDSNLHKKLKRELSVKSSHAVLSRLETVLSPFKKSVRKCLEACSLMDKMRYMGRAIQGLNRQLWQLMGEEEQASCDDILSMLVVALCHMPEDVFIGLYVNVRMLMDIWPPFLDGTLWNCSLVNLYASYDFLFTHNVFEKAVRDYSGSLRLKF